MTQFKRLKGLSKLIAATLAVFMTVQDTGWSAPLQSPASVSASKSSDVSGLRVCIPLTLGHIEEESAPRAQGKRPHVILIQDSHALYSAEQQIVRLILYLQAHYRIRRIMLEGVRGNLDPLLLQMFPDPETRRKILDQYLERGELSGAEVAAVLDSTDTVYSGLEDWPLYEKNYLAYLKAIENREMNLRKLQREEGRLDQARKSSYSDFLNTLHPFLKKEGTSAFDFEDFFHLAAHEIAPERLRRDYPALFLLIAYRQRETVLKSQAVAALERTKQRIRFEILQSLPSEEQARWNETLQRYQTGRTDVWAILDEILRSKVFPKIEETWPRELIKTLRLKRAVGHLRAGELTAEIKRALTALQAEHLQNQEQKALAERYQLLFGAEKSAQLEISREDWDVFHAQFTSPYGKELLETLGASFASVRHFYQAVLRRDEMLFRHFEKGMSRQKKGVVILIAGGFHRTGLVRRLQEKGYGYTVVTPSAEGILSAPAGIYEKVMQGRLSYPVERGENFYDAFMRDAVLSLSKTWNTAAWGREMKIWREAVIRRLAEEKRSGAAYRYTRYLDAAFLQESQGLDFIQGSGSIEDVVRRMDQVFKEFENFIPLRWNTGKISASPISASGLIPLQVLDPEVRFQSKELQTAFFKRPEVRLQTAEPTLKRSEVRNGEGASLGDKMPTEPQKKPSWKSRIPFYAYAALKPGAWKAFVILTLSFLASVVSLLAGSWMAWDALCVGNIVQSGVSGLLALMAVIGSWMSSELILIQSLILWHRGKMPSEVPPPPVQDEFLPAVAVMVPVRHEPIEVIGATVEAAAKLDYPAGKLEIRIIDNSDTQDIAGQPILDNAYETLKQFLKQSPVVQSFRARYGDSAVVLMHREGTEGYKSRNLNIGLSQNHSTYFLQLDADSRVKPETLRTVMPEFVRHETARKEGQPRLAYVQMALDVHNQDQNLLTWTLGVLQSAVEHFWRPLRRDYRISWGFGHHLILSAEAVREAGGFPEDLGVGEDTDLSASIHLLTDEKGRPKWIGKRADYLALEDQIAHSFEGLKIQRWRWAFGSTRVFLNRFRQIRSSALDWHQKYSLIFDLGIYVVMAALIGVTFGLPAWIALSQIVHAAFFLLSANPLHLVWMGILSMMIVTQLVRLISEKEKYEYIAQAVTVLILGAMSFFFPFWIGILQAAAPGLFFPHALAPVIKLVWMAPYLLTFVIALAYFANGNERRGVDGVLAFLSGMTLGFAMIPTIVSGVFSSFRLRHAAFNVTPKGRNGSTGISRVLKKDWPEILTGIYCLVLIPFVPVDYGYTIPALIMGLSLILWPFDQIISSGMERLRAFGSRIKNGLREKAQADFREIGLKKKTFWLLLSIVGMTAVILRFKGLDHTGPWMDEAAYILAGRDTFHPENNWGWINGSKYAWPPLAAFGDWLFGSFIGARVVTAVMGMATVFFGYLFSKSVIDSFREHEPEDVRRRETLASVIILALAPSLVFISQLATYDAMSYMFLAASLFFTHEGARQKRSSWYFFGAASLFAGLLSKYVLVLFLPFMLSYALMVRKDLKAWLKFYIVPFVAASAAYAVTFVQDLRVIATFGVNGFWTDRTLGGVALDIIRFIGLPAALAFLGLRVIPKSKRPQAVWLLGGAGFLAMYHLYYRHIQALGKGAGAMLIIIAPLAGIGLSKLASITMRGKRWKGQITPVILAVLILVYQYIQEMRRGFFWEDLYGPAEVIQKEARKVKKPFIYSTRAGEIQLLVPELKGFINLDAETSEVHPYLQPYTSTRDTLDSSKILRNILDEKYDIVHITPEYWEGWDPDDQWYCDNLRTVLRQKGYVEVYYDDQVRHTSLGDIKKPSMSRVFVHPRLLKQQTHAPTPQHQPANASDAPLGLEDHRSEVRQDFHNPARPRARTRDVRAEVRAQDIRQQFDTEAEKLHQMTLEIVRTAKPEEISKRLGSKDFTQSFQSLTQNWERDFGIRPWERDALLGAIHRAAAEPSQTTEILRNGLSAKEKRVLADLGSVRQFKMIAYDLNSKDIPLGEKADAEAVIHGILDVAVQLVAMNSSFHFVIRYPGTWHFKIRGQTFAENPAVRIFQGRGEIIVSSPASLSEALARLSSAGDIRLASAPSATQGERTLLTHEDSFGNGITQNAGSLQRLTLLGALTLSRPIEEMPLVSRDEGLNLMVRHVENLQNLDNILGEILCGLTSTERIRASA